MTEKSPHTPCEASLTLEILLRQLERLTPALRIPFPNGNGIDFVPEREILYLQANGNYCHLFLLDGRKLLVSLSLKKVESMLNPATFCRVHHSYVINLHHLERYERGEGGTVLMNGEVALPVSKGRRVEFLKIVNKHQT